MIWNVDTIANVQVRAAALFGQTLFATDAHDIAIGHPRAIEYLEAAPIIVLAGRQAVRDHIARGAKVRDLVSDMGLPWAMRHLVPVSGSMGDTVRALAKLDPAALGRVIPRRLPEQRAFQAFMRRWCARDDQPLTVGWAAEHALVPPLGFTDPIAEVRDYVIANRDMFNPRWSWQRVLRDAMEWHRDQRAGQARFVISGWDLGGGRTPLPAMSADEKLGRWPHAEVTSVPPFEIRILRTANELMAEGAALQHCVATYLPDVATNRCHILSVRDEQGRRVATLELTPQFHLVQLQGRRNSLPPADVIAAVTQFVESLGGSAIAIANRQAAEDARRELEAGGRIDELRVYGDAQVRARAAAECLAREILEHAVLQPLVPDFPVRIWRDEATLTNIQPTAGDAPTATPETVLVRVDIDARGRVISYTSLNAAIGGVVAPQDGPPLPHHQRPLTWPLIVPPAFLRDLLRRQR